MKKLFNYIKIFFDGIVQNNIPAHAAACAFYMFLSLVPFFGLLVSVLPYTGLSQDTLVSILSRYIPEALENLIINVTDDIYFASGAVLPIAVIITIWLASRSFFSLIRGVEEISGSKNYSSFLMRTFIACVYTIGLVVTMLLVLAMLVFGKQIIEYIRNGIPIISPVIAFLIKFRFVFVILILSGVFSLIYRWVPGMKLGFGSLFPGAVAAAACWLLFSWLFSLFINYGGGYSIYGSLAAIVISLMWMYWCMYIILLGAYLNIFIYALKTDKLNGEHYEA